MECPRKDSWSWLPFPAPEDLPDPGTEPSSLVSAALAGRFFTTVPSGKPKCQFYWMPKPEMSICLRGSESSAFRTVNLEFHRKMLLLIKANLESGPSVPKCQSSECKRGRGAGSIQGGLRLVSGSSGHTRFCVSRPVSTGHMAQGVLHVLYKIQDNPSNITGLVSQGPVSCLICVSHLSDSGPTAHIIKVSRRVMTQLGQEGAWGPSPTLARVQPLSQASEGA